MKRLILLAVVTVSSSYVLAEQQQGSPSAAFMRALDADGNGSVSKDEFTQPQLQQIVKQFDYMDKNHDSKIDVSEADTFAQEMHQRMQQMQNQGQGTGTPPAANQ